MSRSQTAFRVLGHNQIRPDRVVIRMHSLNVLVHIAFLIEVEGAAHDRALVRLLLRVNPQVCIQLTEAVEDLAAGLPPFWKEVTLDVAEEASFN